MWGGENHWRADCEKLKKHKAEMDADRKRKGLPAFVPRPRAVYALDPEERDASRHDRKIADGDHEDYEVTGLMCDSDDDDADCDALEVDSETDGFRSTGSRDMLQNDVFQFHRNPAHFGNGDFKLYGCALERFEEFGEESDYVCFRLWFGGGDCHHPVGCVQVGPPPY